MCPLTSWPTATSASSSSSAPFAVASRMIFFRAAFRFGASDARRRTNLARPAAPAEEAAQSRSASCSNSRSWEAVFLGPVMMKPAGILPPLFCDYDGRGRVKSAYQPSQYLTRSVLRQSPNSRLGLGSLPQERRDLVERVAVRFPQDVLRLRLVSAAQRNATDRRDREQGQGPASMGWCETHTHTHTWMRASSAGQAVSNSSWRRRTAAGLSAPSKSGVKADSGGDGDGDSVE